MSRGVRIAVALLLAAVLAWVGWLVIQATRADELARSDPEAALRIDPDHPQALLRLAWRQYRAGDDAAALATARHLLAVEPGQGMAFAVIALAAERQGDPRAAKLMAIALERAPRNTEVRAHAAAAALKAGDIEGGLAQLDFLLRLAPERGETLFPALAEQAANPGFGDALAGVLAGDPRWRRGFLRVLEKEAGPEALDNVYAGLQQRGQLSQEETARWIDRMIRDGRWGQAYAHWFSQLDEDTAATLPLLFNGGFEQDPSQLGFDWRNTRAAGVFTDIEPAAGAGGERAAHIHFIGREAHIANLRQPLLLAPGRYRLSLRARAQFLRSEKGWYWTIRCVPGGEVARAGPLEGSFPWETHEVVFSIPDDCPGQWLELRNPAVAGSRETSGDLWIDDMAITPLAASSGR